MRTMLVALSVGLLGACALPRGGPSTSEVVESNQTQIQLVPITQWQAEAGAADAMSRLPDTFRAVGSTDFQTLRTGDILSVTISEASGNGSFPQTIASPITMDSVEVASDGAITVPFAGRVQAEGMTTAELTTAIRRRLVRQLYGPQVFVSRTGSTSRSVTVTGDVVEGGALELTPQTSSLSAVIGAAGLVREEGAEYVVEVHRNGATAEVGLNTLYSDPTYDIALMPGDVISLRRDSRFYIIMGAVGEAARVPLPRNDYMLMDALGSARGLEDATADPTGVFVFRRGANVANATGQDVIYRMNMSDPSNIFAATSFPLLPGDIVYVSFAPFNQTQKVLRAISGVSSLASSATRIR
ncbi:polysaccharide biosynthesis/export family protein [Aurantiacibacter rhizosphaerae]|nr:polysaccharide biosynthesis/export family protein [Aurantiacibacter rhizosphaerae]